MSRPDLGGPTPTENSSKLSMRKVLAGRRPKIPNTNSAGTNKTSASRRDQTLITKGNRTERVSENKIEIGSLQIKTKEPRRNLWRFNDQLRLRPRERVGREHSAMLAPVAMPDWLSEPSYAPYQPVRAKNTARRAGSSPRAWRHRRTTGASQLKEQKRARRARSPSPASPLPSPPPRVV
jgi:hypothetical protein